MKKNDNIREVDMVIISWAKDDKLRKITEDGILTCIKNDPDIKFNFYIVETNKDINYDHFPHTKTIHLEENSSFGYHKYLNIGRRAGNSKYVCLCNNDLTYENLWATHIIGLMEANPDIKSASPWCPQTQRQNTGHEGNAYLGYRVRGELAGWCIFQQREIYETIGDLDETFTHWYCDNDYAMTLHKLGISHALVPSSVVNHHADNNGITHNLFTNDYIQKTTRPQRHVYINKWNEYIHNNNNLDPTDLT